VTDVADSSPHGWAALPRWARLGLIALAAVVVALIAIVVVRLVTRVPPIPYGVTATDDLRPGSCLAESQADLDEYTVIPCGQAHPQQVFATADLELDDTVYALVESSLVTFGDQVCDRYLEYRLYLREGLETGGYEAYAIAVPDPEAYAAGDTEAVCALAAADGTDITGDAYRPMP
jgi:hypothetical protein